MYISNLIRKYQYIDMMLIIFYILIAINSSRAKDQAKAFKLYLSIP